MGIADEVKNLGEDIVASYNARVKAIGTLVKDTHQMLNGFHAEHKEMSEKLKEDLAKGEKDRLAGFKAMWADIKKFVTDMVEGTAKLMRQIRAEQKDRNKAVADLLEKFDKDHEAMAAELKKALAKGETDRLEDFKEMMKGIQKYVADVVKETKKLIKEIQARQDERNKEVLDLLEAFKTEREKMAANWQALVATMDKRRGGKPVLEAKEEVSTVNEFVKKIEKVPEKVKAKETVEMSLEERVLELINKHPEGIRVGNMEEPLGTTRNKLGQAAKRLLDKGKVRKEENLYFPL